MFVTPVIYPLGNFPERYQLIAALNPMAGVVEGFRFAVLGSSVSWDVVCVSLTVATAAFVTGMFFFRRLERTFADLI
jgi:lipopolysaccharide transport system permease protein